MSQLVSYLFDTNAIRVCPKDFPFWYTSGKIGPYFVNAQFLYGSEKDSADLLEFINTKLDQPLALPFSVFDRVKKQYEENDIYRHVIDETVRFIQENISLDSFDYISGGERRDWFFSYMIAFLLKKPHLSIFKDLSCVESDFQFCNNTSILDIEGKKVLHIADLYNTASSYVRAWIPAIENLGGKMIASLAMVDRMQGGCEVLEEHDVASYSLIQMNEALFQQAMEQGIISDSQLQMVLEFMKDPDSTMKSFIKEHPDFIENALHADAKTAARAKLCIEGKFYE